MQKHRRYFDDGRCLQVPPIAEMSRTTCFSITIILYTVVCNSNKYQKRSKTKLVESDDNVRVQDVR